MTTPPLVEQLGATICLKTGMECNKLDVLGASGGRLPLISSRQSDMMKPIHAHGAGWVDGSIDAYNTSLHAMEVAMPTFLCFLNWTDQGAKNAKDANKRFQASKSLAEKLGGKLQHAYVTTGQYDVVLTLDMPNGEAMARFASAISGSGNARATTVRGYTPDEFSKLVAEAPKF